MSDHTESPWTAYTLSKPLSEIPAYVEDCIAVSSGESYLIIRGKNEKGQDVDICHIGNGPKGPYNARLIAAAPELLVALQRLMGETHGLQDALEAVAQARAALVKATGEKQ